MQMQPVGTSEYWILKFNTIYYFCYLFETAEIVLNIINVDYKVHCYVNACFSCLHANIFPSHKTQTEKYMYLFAQPTFYI